MELDQKFGKFLVPWRADYINGIAKGREEKLGPQKPWNVNYDYGFIFRGCTQYRLSEGRFNANVSIKQGGRVFQYWRWSWRGQYTVRPPISRPLLLRDPPISRFLRAFQILQHFSANVSVSNHYDLPTSRPVARARRARVTNVYVWNRAYDLEETKHPI